MLPSARIKLIEDSTRDGCESQANEFLASIPLSRLMDVSYGMVPTSLYLSIQRFEYWCLIIYRET